MRLLNLLRRDPAPSDRPQKRPRPRPPVRGNAGAGGRVRPLFLALSLICGIAGSVYATNWLFENGTVAAWGATLRAEVVAASLKAGFALRQVDVQGREQVSRDAILGALDVRLGDPILFMNLAALRGRLEALGWVRSAIVERRLPGALFIRLEERIPAAIRQQDGQRALIDADGALIGVEGLDRYPHLKILTGTGGDARVRAMLTLLDAAPGLRDRVVAAVWVGGRRWNLHLQNGIDIRLPERAPELALRELARLQKEKAILSRAISVIDMRQKDRMVLRVTSRGRQQRPTPSYNAGAATPADQDI